MAIKLPEIIFAIFAYIYFGGMIAVCAKDSGVNRWYRMLIFALWPVFLVGLLIYGLILGAKSLFIDE